ncbi:hypothetical protein HB364_17860 [Pseudoflavitalea sp. X16]|uniref:hypothetical protein n=1 Tax=Paraflavitalea devenefica TaxID=2716334 RepID=UPI0014240DF2|nr:hypothetical protein [Paraflavitalea devenefica]NII26961.1 hypothetical protein [Paraflavitalea devenefica]
MSTNGLTAAEAQASKTSPIAKGYTKWFSVEFKNIIFDPSILHRKEAIEGYYIGYLTGYNTIKAKRYAILFEWTEEPSELPNCKDFTLHVYINPPPTRKGKTENFVAVTLKSTAALADPVTGKEDIDPPTPPPPPPPTM